MSIFAATIEKGKKGKGVKEMSIEENRNADTICAIATAQGGAIGIVRVSGPAAISITSAIFKPAKSGMKLEDAKPYTLTYGQVTEDNGEPLDDVLVSLFRAPHSYTGEDSTEIACHGSRYILQRVLQLLIDHGCRMALPGEYTERAFLNGKMDLSQAEAVADLIASQSAATHRLAMNQMRGGFSRELQELREKLLHFTSLIELELDFSDHEDLEFADRNELKELAAHIEQVISRLADSFSLGNAIKNGIPVAIIGQTNAGKSTLLNALLNDDKAIVSEVSGTTRDVIEDTVNIGGMTFRFIDTAGIRDTTDRIETLGIERTFKMIDQAEIVLWLIDSTQAAEQIAELSSKVLPHCVGKHLVLIYNKVDLADGETRKNASVPAGFPEGTEAISISAKTGQNLDGLQQLLLRLSNVRSISSDEVIVSNARHYESLKHALDAIRRVRAGLADGLSGDLLSQDIRECTYHLGNIVGTVTSEDVLQNIFRHFCIGK